MKAITPVLCAILMGVGMTAAFNASAAECTSSFYCYGNTGNAVVRVAPRPPPIPPPNPRVVQQRRQAQLALRNSAPAPRIARPAATPAPQRVTPQVARPTPRANVRVATPVPRPAPQPARAAGSCQDQLARAAQLESQAVIASKQGKRQDSVRLFKEAANARQQACR